MNDENCAVNILLERARTVPKDFRGEWESMWHEDGTPRGYSMAPVGLYVHELADEVERLAAENRKLKEGLLEALEWNWCDEDFPESLFHNLSLLAGGQGLVGQTASTRRDIGREVLDSINELKEQDKGYSYEIEYYANGIRSHYIEGCLCSSCEMARRAGKPPESK